MICDRCKQPFEKLFRLGDSDLCADCHDKEAPKAVAVLVVQCAKCTARAEGPNTSLHAVGWVFKREGWTCPGCVQKAEAEKEGGMKSDIKSRIGCAKKPTCETFHEEGPGGCSKFEDTALKKFTVPARGHFYCGCCGRLMATGEVLKRYIHKVAYLCPECLKLTATGEPTDSISEILAEREKRYGAFTEHAKITQNIKRAMMDSPNWNKLADDKKEALEMVAHKMGRILNGDPDYDDSWKDMAGYSKLVADRLASKS